MTENSIEIIISLNDGETIVVSDGTLLAAPKLEINNRAVSEEDFSYGSVYMGECKFAFITSLDRYRLYGARVEIHDSLGSRGEFYITEAIRQDDYISVTAYDCMDHFDADVTEDVSGTAFEILTHICDKFGVDLGNTKQEISSFPNGTFGYRVVAETAGTYRDVISYVATLLCCFATIDNNGCLRLCRFSHSVTSTVDTDMRTEVEISDFETRYNHVSATFADSMKYEASDEDNNGLSLNLGNIPIVYGLVTTKQQIIDNILREVSSTVYTPCKFSTVNDCRVSLGDRIFLPNAGRTGFDVETLVMEYTWVYKSSCSIKAVGSNPLMKKASDIENRQRASSQEEISKKEIAIYTHTNIADITVNTEDNTVATIVFSSKTDTTAIVLATVPFSLSNDGNVLFSYYYDSIHLTESDVTSYFLSGKHAVTLANYFSVSANMQHTVIIKARTAYTESDKRITEAVTNTHSNFLTALQEQSTFTPTFDNCTVDTTPPTMLIEKSAIKAALFGQGLVSTGNWDGNIFAYDDVSPVIIGGFAVNRAITDVAAGELIPVSSAMITEQMPMIALGSLRVSVPYISPEVNKVIHQAVIACENNDELIQIEFNINKTDQTKEHGFSLRQKFLAEGEVVPIDSGNLHRTVFDQKQAQRIDEINFYTGGMLEEM